MTYYLGIVARGADGAFGAVFPDLPVCTTMGDDLDDLFKSGAEALRLWAEAALDAGEAIPPPIETALIQVPFLLIRLGPQRAPTCRSTPTCSPRSAKPPDAVASPAQSFWPRRPHAKEASIIATPTSILVFACALITAASLAGYLVVVFTDKRAAHRGPTLIGDSALLWDSYSGNVTIETRPAAHTEAPLPRPGTTSPV